MSQTQNRKPPGNSGAGSDRDRIAQGEERRWAFHPDIVVANDNLKDWERVGAASWSMQDGVLRADPKRSGGWLVLRRAYQDVNLYTEFRCGKGCAAGVLLRAEPTPSGGLKGIFISLAEPDLPASRRGGGNISPFPPQPIPPGHSAGRAPTEDNLLVFYIPDPAEWSAAVARMREAGFDPVPAFNPYWDQNGCTFEDPDGYRIVIQKASWDI